MRKSVRCNKKDSEETPRIMRVSIGFQFESGSQIWIIEKKQRRYYSNGEERYCSKLEY